MAKGIKLTLVLTALSLAMNIFFIRKEIRLYYYKSAMNTGFQNFGINDSSDFTGALRQFFTEHPGKRYVFISTWAAFCKPCLQEMPILDSMINLRNKEMEGYFVTDVTPPDNKYAGLKFKNFRLLYHQHALISAIHNKFGMKQKTYPVNLVVDRQLTVYFFNSTGIDFKTDTTLKRSLESLPTLP